MASQPEDKSLPTITPSNHELEAGPRSDPSPEPYTIYTRPQTVFIVFLVSLAATFSGFASNIYFPALPVIATDLHVSPSLINLTVTTYMIFQGLSPTIWGAVSDAYGRRVAYICTFFVFIAACVGLALSRTYAGLMVLRCLQSAGSASTIAIGSGVIGDITTRQERGSYIGFFTAGQLSPVAIGPVLGGVFAQTLGWRSVFWFLTIAAVVVLVLLLLGLPETLRSLVGNGQKPAKGLSKSPLASRQRRKYLEVHPDRAEKDTVTSTPVRKKGFDIFGTVRILSQLEVTFAISFSGIYYMVWQSVLTALSTLFHTTYHLDESHIGLVYLANGTGCIIGTLLAGKLLDLDYGKIKARYTGPPQDFPLEHARLRMIWLYAGLQIGSVVVFGWTVERAIHIAAPVVCLFVLGWTTICIHSTVSTFLVDVYPNRGASATAALNLVRCLLGAAGTAAVTPCIDRIRVGWTCTLFAAIELAAFAFIVLQLTKGPAWRRKRERREAEVTEG